MADLSQIAEEDWDEARRRPRPSARWPKSNSDYARAADLEFADQSGHRFTRSQPRLNRLALLFGGDRVHECAQTSGI